MNINLRTLISAMTAGLIGVGNWAASVVTSDGSFSMISIFIGLGFAATAVGNDIRQQMKLPPVK